MNDLETCDYCGGTGVCPDCDGRGRYDGSNATCADCKGSTVCQVCEGLGRVKPDGAA